MRQAVVISSIPFVSKNLEFSEKNFNNMSLNEIPKGRNKVGFNLLLWTASISDKMNPVAERLKNIGYDGVEVSMGELQRQPYFDFGKHLKSIDMEVTTVYAGGTEEDPISESPIVRQKALDKLKWVVDRSNDMGSHLICGPMHSAFAHFRKRPPTEEEYQWSSEVLHKYHSTYGYLYNHDIWGTCQSSILTAVGLLFVFLWKEDEFRNDDSHHQHDERVEE